MLIWFVPTHSIILRDLPLLGQNIAEGGERGSLRKGGEGAKFPERGKLTGLTEWRLSRLRCDDATSRVLAMALTSRYCKLDKPIDSTF
jgi:hypothetical protein